MRYRSRRFRPFVLLAITVAALAVTVERVGEATTTPRPADAQPAAAGPAMPVVPAGEPLLDHRGDLLLVGDSLTLGADAAGGLSSRLEADGWHPTIIAERGQGTAWGVGKVNRLAHVPELVVVALGTNPWSTIGTYPNDVRAMVDALKERGAQVIVWITPVSGHGDDRYDDKDAVLYDTAEEDAALLVADWATLAKSHPEWFGSDDIHYVDAGYEALARFIVDHVGALASPE